MERLKYLKLLAKQYPSIADVTTELINLNAILNLPKGTEHFLTDIHGEYEAFSYHLRSASGVLMFKIDDIFGYSIPEWEKKNLATLICYPHERLKRVKEQEQRLEDWYRVNIYRLLSVCKVVSSKYTRSKVRKSLPSDFTYILDELLNLESTQLNKEDYYNQIINTIVELDRSDEFIAAISKVIQRLAVDRLHIIGDIYDRGSAPEKVMDELMAYHSVDIQWGNHDILWMGAAQGHPLMVATAIRIALRYGNLECLEEGYGINMLPLGHLAMDVYKDDPCEEFMPRQSNEEFYAEKDRNLIARMHKAIAIIQFKLEGQLIKRRKEFAMDDRNLLEQVDYKNGSLMVNGREYSLTSCHFPTIDPKDPCQLTTEEQEVIDRLSFYFRNSEKLQKHIHFFYTNGALYLRYNGNLLYHGSVLLNKDGSFQNFTIDGEDYQGKALLDKLEALVRKAHYTQNINDVDWLWYMWTGPKSPMFAKQKMATFERYFTREKSLHKEALNPYFTLRENSDICRSILLNFGLNPEQGHIITGHTPVKAAKGESPIKADGRLLVIDGGLSMAYQAKTGLAGYTLIYNSWGLRLVSHKPFQSVERVIEEGVSVNSEMRVLKKTNRKRVADTDVGKSLLAEMEALRELLTAYQSGQLHEGEQFIAG
ncbi:fructose-1,6-bisphosphatase [Endozoicomonas lisbonensis]|uniref:Fructose-1,6-bisphosphatase class 3 n=1 Tax=Endozoicomonas lisbonensis TaxID=3120522 RepID=A0ABV2SMP0_9GAMM